MIKNALIRKTMLGYEDYEIMTCSLDLDYGDNRGQTFGGYALDKPLKDKKGNFIKRIGSTYGMEFIKQILDTVGVEKWEDLKGKYIRVKFDDKPMGWGSNIVAIGHITQEKWFSPEELGKKYFPEKKEKK